MRMCAVIVAMSVLALALVFLRGEQARCAARIMAIESQWVSARRALWSIQTRTARLRAPQQVHDRTLFLQTGVIPSDETIAPEPPAQLVDSLRRTDHDGVVLP